MSLLRGFPVHATCKTQGQAVPLKVTNEVSIMDVVAIGGLLIGGAAVFFGYGVDISTNATQITQIKDDVIKIERRAELSEGKILDQLKQQGETMKDIQKESADSRLRIEDKLDRLIERQLPSAK